MLEDKRNQKYRDLIDYDKVESMFLTLEGVDWQLVRNLITRQQQIDYVSWLRFYFEHELNQNYGHRTFEASKWPGYGPAPRAYHNRYIYLVHHRLLISERGQNPLWKEMQHAELALPISIDENAKRAADKEMWGREKNYYIRLAPSADKRQHVAEQLKGITQSLAVDEQLRILLEFKMPSLYKLSWQGASYMLGKVHYFFDRWKEFHEYEQQNDPILPESITVHESGNNLSKKLSLRQVALLHIYRGLLIPKSGADNIARQFGHSSGSKLYDHYRSLVLPEQRIHVDGKALEPLITDIQTVAALLNDDERIQPEKEIVTLSKRK